MQLRPLGANFARQFDAALAAALLHHRQSGHNLCPAPELDQLGHILKQVSLHVRWRLHVDQNFRFLAGHRPELSEDEEELEDHFPDTTLLAFSLCCANLYLTYADKSAEYLAFVIYDS